MASSLDADEISQGPAKKQKLQERIGIAFEMQEPSVLNQTVSIMIGKAPYHMQCHGFLPTMARASRWIAELLRRHLDEGAVGETQLTTTLHIAQELYFDTPPRKEALRVAWQFMHMGGPLPHGFDRATWDRYRRHQQVIEQQRAQARQAIRKQFPPSLSLKDMHSRYNQSDATIFDILVPPLDTIPRDVWVHRLDMLQHLRILIDYFDIIGLGHRLHWEEWIMDLVRGGTCAARACKLAGPFPPSTPQDMLEAARAARDTMGNDASYLVEGGWREKGVEG
jgi:hypothetical protein